MVEVVVTRRLSWDQYATAWARVSGGLDPRLAAPSVRRWHHTAYRVGSVLGRIWVRPGALSLVAILVSVGVPVLAVRPSWGPVVAAGLVLLVAMADSVRGAVALTTGRMTRLGYVYDAFADRLTEALWLAAFWRLRAPEAVVAVAGGLSWLHEYVRTRALVAGMNDAGLMTVAERPTRISIALVGLLVTGLAGLIMPSLRSGAVTVVATVWLLLALFGLGQMLAAVRRALR